MMLFVMVNVVFAGYSTEMELVDAVDKLITAYLQ